MRRWLLVAVVAGIGCKSSDKKAAPMGTTDAAAPPSAADASVAPGPAAGLPVGAICTGHWTAKLDYTPSKTCKNDPFAPYRELDMTLEAGPTGWVARIEKPAGITVSSTHVMWSTGDQAQCNAKVVATKPGVELSIGVYGGRPSPFLNALLELGEGDAACIGNGSADDIVFRRDAGMLPPPAPELVTLAGSYDISFELPKKYRCKDEAAKLPRRQTFDVSIDRTFGDMLVVTGVDGGWEDNGVENEEGNLSLHLRLPVHYVEQAFNLHVDGTQVTGTLSTNPTEVDVKPSCTPWLAGVKVSGTRTPPP